MGRRILALIGLLVLVILAMTLFWRVYMHHMRAEPFDPDALVETVEVLRGLPSTASG